MQPSPLAGYTNTSMRQVLLNLGVDKNFYDTQVPDGTTLLTKVRLEGTDLILEGTGINNTTSTIGE